MNDKKKTLFDSVEAREAYIEESVENDRYVKLETPVPCTSEGCLNAAYVASITYYPQARMWGLIALCRPCSIRLGQMYDVANTGTVDSTSTNIGPIDQR